MPGRAARRALASALIAIAFWVPDAGAFDERVTLTQSAGGSITATLSGSLFPCTYGFAGAPVITRSAGQVLIASNAVAMGCPVFEGAKAVPFMQDATLGPLADGAYTLRWTQTDAAPQFQIQQQFSVKAGFLSVPGLEPVPTSSHWSLFLSMLLVWYVGARHWRPPTRRSTGRPAGGTPVNGCVGRFEGCGDKRHTLR